MQKHVVEGSNVPRVRWGKANTQLTVLKMKVVAKYPFGGSYYLERDPYLRSDPAVLLWQRQEQWNTKETKVARLSLRLKRDDSVVPSLWLELLTGENPLKWPPPPVQPAYPLALQRHPSAPCCPFSAQLTDWLNCYYARKHNNRQQHHLISTKDLHRHRSSSGIWTSAQKSLVSFTGCGWGEVPEGPGVGTLTHTVGPRGGYSYGLMSSSTVPDCWDILGNISHTNKKTNWDFRNLRTL